MAFSFIFIHFSQFLAKNGWFWKWNWSQECSIFQSAIEMSRFWLKWGVYQHQRMRHCGGMAFSFIFSHFSQFLAKNGCFWKWNWNQECSIFQSAVEMSRFWLKWGVNQVCTMSGSRFIAILRIFPVPKCPPGKNRGANGGFFRYDLKNCSKRHFKCSFT